MEYSIRYVYDTDTGELFDAEQVFSNKEQNYAVRRAYHLSGQRLHCYACNQKATMSVGHGTMHFKHYPNTSDCYLKDSSFTFQERRLIEQHLVSKEGARHKTLKGAIGEYLITIPGVETDSILVDNRFLKDTQEKRRPDVFCVFRDKQIAFEIQLSNLPPKYIFKRHEFYKRNQIFLIWILDDFDAKEQNQTEKDIKYLAKHQNFFSFNDVSPNQSLIVLYKKQHANQRSETYFEWTHESVGLGDLQFNTADFQCYFVSYEEEVKKANDEEFRRRYKYLIDCLRKFYKTDDERVIPDFHKIIEMFDVHDFQVLKRVLGLDNGLLLRAAKEGKSHFLIYFLEHSFFGLELNPIGNESDTLFQNILQCDKLRLRWDIVDLIFHNGYDLTDTDMAFLKTFHFPHDPPTTRSQRVIKIYAYNVLKDKKHIKWLDRIEGTIFTILSAKFNCIVGHGFKNLISLANNAIENYKSTFPFIEQALKFYNVWDTLVAEDKNKTFFKKYQNQASIQATQPDLEAHFVLKKLFPEVFNQGGEFVEWISLENIP